MPPEEHDVTAAELALGLLEGDERAAALRRVLADPAFAADVAWWRDALAPLVAGIDETAPPPHLEARVMAAVEGQDEVTLAVRWRAIAVALAACLVAAVALLAMLREPVVRLIPMPAPTQLIAAIQPSDGKTPPLAAAYNPASGEIRLSGSPAVPPARVAELWVIGKDGPPRSLGLLRGTGATRLAIAPPRRGLLTDGVTLAVSVEPAGGSPTGLPTGPVVATGTLAKV